MIGNNTRIGWIGTGVMGAPMCGHILSAGYPVYVYSRSPVKAQALIDGGARWCSSPAEVARASDVVFTMVGVPDEVEAVYFGSHGVLEGVEAGMVLVDMSTTAPSLSQRIHAAAADKAVQTVDAPVSGGDVGAKNATLTVMAGGDRDTVTAIQPLFDVISRVVNYMGAAGNGQHAKMCNQLVVAGTMIGVCEALVYASRAGLDCEKLVEAIRPGAAGCWTLENLAPRINRNDYAPGFMAEHFVKDLGIALREAQHLGLKLPGLELALELYRQLLQMGHGRSGTQALIHVLRSWIAS
jgi:3-hydroxyisobutyrate dehydrogenase